MTFGSRDPIRPLVDMRSLMAGFPTGVSIVTARNARGECWGMTCSSVCSVALDPPTLLVCLRDGSPTLGATLDSGWFAVNLLQSRAQGIARLFASGAPDRFSRVRWQVPARAGGPHLVDDSHTTADCEVANTHLIGDHCVVFGAVRSIVRRHEPQPLLYGLRRYAVWSAEDAG